MPAAERGGTAQPAACTSPLEEKLWEILTPTLVQGDLDALYLGEFNENYLDLTGASEEDCQSAYEQNLSLSADIFARCFGITNLTDDLRSEVEDLYREIYARAHYSVVGAVQIDETHYTVTVNVEPMDFFTPCSTGSTMPWPASAPAGSTMSTSPA